MAERIEEQIKLLEEEAASKQQFIDNFAHEIRTPLTSIYGYAEYIQKAPLDEHGVIDSTQSIINEANHMKRIADSLLKLATLRNFTLTKSAISIPHLFEDVEQTLKSALLEKDILLICRYDIETLEGQEDLIKSLLLNLCSNSIKFCTPSSGRIFLEATVKDDKTVLSVTDNGCGISREELSKITEPFYRADKARSREQGGAGLGLALCKQIAELHGAEMSIESSTGVGTSVKITFTTL
jgi:signal transduction histidine kinase